MVKKSKIGKLKKAEEAIKQTVERYRKLLNDAPVGICEIDVRDKRFVSVNDVMCEYTGYTKEELLLMSPLDILTEDSKKRFLKSANKILAGQKGPESAEYRIAAKNGQKLFVISDTKLMYEKGTPKRAIVIFHKIRTRDQINEELLKIKKLQSISVFAAGITHDFNNLLTIILGNISMVKEYAKPEYGISEFVTDAEKACLRAKNLTAQLMSLSKGGYPIKKTGSISELIKEAANLSLRDSNVKCHFLIPEDLWQVEFDEIQMAYVIDNVIINADEAMPKGGRIEVRAENLIIKENKIVLGHLLQKGKYVKISIRDQGIGVPLQNIANIFDPYFSTKERGTRKGVGLGLATAYSVIKKHNGNITVESEVGVGTTFHIYLPAAEKRDPRKGGHKRKPLMGKRKVLLMDDEEMLRGLGRKMLRSLKCQAELAEDGAEAVELYKKARESGEPFDVVILDLTVQEGLGGKEAIRELKQIDPGVKAIISTGYSNDDVVTNFKEYGFSAVLKKPYQKKDLNDALVEIMIKGGK